jgi:hypothetical protein
MTVITGHKNAIFPGRWCETDRPPREETPTKLSGGEIQGDDGVVERAAENNHAIRNDWLMSKVVRNTQ